MQPYSELERKVREATRNKPWGPHGTVLSELAQLSHSQVRMPPTTGTKADSLSDHLPYD